MFSVSSHLRALINPVGCSYFKHQDLRTQFQTPHKFGDLLLKTVKHQAATELDVLARCFPERQLIQTVFLAFLPHSGREVMMTAPGVLNSPELSLSCIYR